MVAHEKESKGKSTLLASGTSIQLDDAGHVKGLDLDFKRKDALERRNHELARTRIKPGGEPPSFTVYISATQRSGKELTRFNHPFTNCGNLTPNAW